MCFKFSILRINSIKYYILIHNKLMRKEPCAKRFARKVREEIRLSKEFVLIGVSILLSFEN